MPTVGELFVNLGIKGGDKTLGTISGASKGLKDTASKGWEAKVAIVGAMYALERLFAASGARGTELTNLNAILGGSTKTLQQYQWAAQQVGVSNGEVEASFKTLQSSMTKTATGMGVAPAGMRNVSLLTGNDISSDMIKKFAAQPQLLVARLQEYAQKETNIGLRNEVLRSFGIGDGMISALARNAFRPDVMAKAPTYSEAEIKSLDRANIAWSNLSTKIEMAVGHFNAMHGGALVRDISMIVDKVVKMTEAFVKLSDKIHLFKALGMVFEGWGIIFDSITAGVEAVERLRDDDEKAQAGHKNDGELGPKKGGGWMDDWFGLGETGNAGLGLATAFVSMLGQVMEDTIGHSESEVTPEMRKRFDAARKGLGRGEVPVHAVAGGGRPKAPALPAGAAAGGQTTVTQTLIFDHAGKDAKATGDSVKEAAKRAVWQIQTNSSGGF